MARSRLERYRARFTHPDPNAGQPKLGKSPTAHNGGARRIVLHSIMKYTSCKSRLHAPCPVYSSSTSLSAIERMHALVGVVMCPRRWNHVSPSIYPGESGDLSSTGFSSTGGWRPAWVLQAPRPWGVARNDVLLLRRKDILPRFGKAVVHIWRADQKKRRSHTLAGSKRLTRTRKARWCESDAARLGQSARDLVAVASASANTKPGEMGIGWRVCVE